MAARNLIELILKVSKTGKGVEKAGEELEVLDKKTAKASTGLGGLGKALGVAGVAAGVATAAIFAFKQAMDMGREGAVAVQTAESFDFLMGKVGESTGLLDELRSASRGTVDDMTLMESTTALLAGTQGELSARMAEAAPRLMEIAKAANKLSPSLGDTTYMYKSLALGIKRAQPDIIDNLNITMKVGEANEAMAAKLGKSVEALTAEEKQLAILEETLRAGSVMIDQVGGDTESATDAFDNLAAALKNTADEGKTKLVPVMSEIARGLTDIINKTLLADRNMRGVGKQALEQSDTYTEYALKILEAGYALDQLPEHVYEAARAMIIHGDSLYTAADKGAGFETVLGGIVAKLGLLTKAEWDAVAANEAEAKAWDRLYGASKRVAVGIAGITTAEEEAEKATRDLAKATGFSIDQIKRYRQEGHYTDAEIKGIAEDLEITGGEFDALADSTGISREQLEIWHLEVGGGEQTLADYIQGLEDAADQMEDFTGTLDEALIGLRDIDDEIGDIRKEFKATASDINTDLGASVGDIRDKYDQMLPDPTTVRERMGMTEDVWDEHYLRIGALLDGVNSADEQRWLEQTQRWTAGTEFMRQEGESQEAWLERVRAAYYDNALPPEFYNTQTAQYQAFVSEKTRLADEEIAEAERVAAEEKRIAKEKKDAAIAEARTEREGVILQEALKVADSMGLIEQWANDTQGALAPARDSWEEVWAGVQAGTIPMSAIEGMVAGPMAMLLGTLENTEEAAGGVETGIHDMVTTAQTEAQALVTAWQNIQTELDNSTAGMGDFKHAMAPPEEEETFLSYLQTELGLLQTAMGDTAGASKAAWVGEEGGALPAVKTGLGELQTEAETVTFPGIELAAKNAGSGIKDFYTGPKGGVLPLLEKAFENLRKQAWWQFISGENSIKKGLDRLSEAVDDLTTDVDFLIMRLREAIRLTDDVYGGENKQHGGPVVGGQPYMVGEVGPELFVPNASGTIVPNHSVNNYFNLTTQTGMDSGGVAADFAMMEALV